MSIPKTIITVLIALFIICYGAIWVCTHLNINQAHHTGDVLDEFNHVKIYYNGGVSHVEGRNFAPDGYNIGLKYQCVEFVKRYYYEIYHHKMPEPRGNAKDFFDRHLASGQINPARGLIQFSNGTEKPQIGDLLIIDGYWLNRYGHVGIISNVTDHFIELAQQNPGPFAKSRVQYLLTQEGGKWTIHHDRVLGFLRMPNYNGTP